MDKENRLRIDFRDDVFRQRISVYGQRSQFDIRQEERAEFIKEISKYKRGKGVKYHLLEETADLMIMIRQVMIMCGIEKWELQNEIFEKTKRLEINLELEGYSLYDDEDGEE